jgi:glycosyltransferase involved in cell wall biosynthesis
VQEVGDVGTLSEQRYDIFQIQFVNRVFDPGAERPLSGDQYTGIRKPVDKKRDRAHEVLEILCAGKCAGREYYFRIFADTEVRTVDRIDFQQVRADAVVDERSPIVGNAEIAQHFVNPPRARDELIRQTVFPAIQPRASRHVVRSSRHDGLASSGEFFRHAGKCVRVAGMGMNNVELVIAHDVAEPTHAGHVGFGSHGHAVFFDRDAAVIVGENRTTGAAGDADAMTAFREFLDQPAGLLLTAAPSGLFVDMKNLHINKADPADPDHRACPGVERRNFNRFMTKIPAKPGHCLIRCKKGIIRARRKMTDRMRIAHVNLARGFRGGERQTQILIEGLSETGVEQKLVARKGEPLADCCVAIDGLEVVTVPNNVLSAMLALDDVGLVHIHEGRAVQAGYLNYLFRGIPYLVTRRVQKGPRHNPVTRTMYSQAGRVVVLSEAIRRSMAALDSRIECEVIPDASSQLTMDPVEREKLRARFGGGFIVGHVGELDDSHKGQRQILDCARQLLPYCPDLTFVLVGSGRDEKILKQEAADLPNCVFAGQVDNVGDYLSAFDALIYPSRHEGLGSTLLDAMVHGLPIVATSVGGIPELIDNGQNGFLCDVNDAAALSDAVLVLYRNADLRGRIGQANVKKAAQYAPDRMTGSYVEIYERLLEEQSLEAATI